MLRIGVKLLHDGAVAMLDGAELVASIEVEKLANHPRYSAFAETGIDVSAVLEQAGVAPSDAVCVILDGWDDPHLEPGADGQPLRVAPYHEQSVSDDPLVPVVGDNFSLGSRAVPYRAYMHVTGHALGAYATSPFAARREPSLALVWDGGMLPRLYLCDPAARTLRPLGPLLPLVGNVFAAVAAHFEPFADPDGRPPSEEAELTVPGKAMAYAACGEVDPQLFALFDRTYATELELSRAGAYRFGRRIADAVAGSSYTGADVIASFQTYVAGLLVKSLAAALRRIDPPTRNLCFVGGCALNIVWNSALRDAAVVDELWVPPFPNDSGSALGAAIADAFVDGVELPVEWDVYRGPALVVDGVAAGWEFRPCSLAELGRFLHESGTPVVFLQGRAELGPRALGHRSILCAPVAADTKDRLNEMKGRAAYRPVAPVCLEADAPAIFDPGTPDPYMLFTHRVRPDWAQRIPAIVHLDGTARLQTISSDSDPQLVEVIRAYRETSGIPVLCNTSANFRGCGFFPSLRSATDWDPATHVWCENRLYSRRADTR